jgi:hypothetical protein
LVIVPDGLEWGWNWSAQETRTTFAAPLVMVLLLLSLGTFYQWCLAIGPRGGTGVFWVVVILLAIPAHIAGDYYHLRILAGFSPSAHFAHWLGGMPELPLYPMVAAYGLLGAASVVSFRDRMVRRAKIVDQKLELMGVTR